MLPAVIELHDAIRTSVVAACEAQRPADLAKVAAADAPGDTIYRIDRVGEALLIPAFAAIARRQPLVLIAEGLPEEGVALPAGTPPETCHWRVVVDPIDGTRGIMYQKRSAWILTGIAPNRGARTRLSDIEIAVQTEIPLVKQHLSDQLHAVRGEGVTARRFNRITGEIAALEVRPSRATTIEHGFASVVRFFPGARDVLAAIDDEVVRDVLGPGSPGRAGSFEDQYACTGGQLHELMSGRDRFIADLRPLMAGIRAGRGLPNGLCCHPYDLCSALIAQEAGVIVTDAIGAALDSPLDIVSDVAWVGYANDELRAALEPALQAALRKRGLIAEPVDGGV